MNTIAQDEEISLGEADLGPTNYILEDTGVQARLNIIDVDDMRRIASVLNEAADEIETNE